MQKASHTPSTRRYLLSLLNDLLVKSCDADNILENDDLVDDEGEYISFTSNDVLMECYKIFYFSRGFDIIDSLDFTGGNETYMTDI